MILELKDICKTYLQGKLEVPVLKDVTLSVDEGEYVAIMGPSGSGKTTLMNIIGCLDSPTSGEYLLEGKNVAGISDKKMSDVRLRSIGFVFQSFYLLSRQSALDNVALPLLYAGVNRKERSEIARKALKRVGLGDRTDFKPTQLSGGQCQRVAIARAIVNNPKILLADEPTGALDTKSGEQIMEIFQSLNQEGVTILMITHEPEIAAHAKRVLYIRDGLLTAAPQASRSDGLPGASGSGASPAPQTVEAPAVEAPAKGENVQKSDGQEQAVQEMAAQGRPAAGFAMPEAAPLPPAVAVREVTHLEVDMEAVLGRSNKRKPRHAQAGPARPQAAPQPANQRPQPGQFDAPIPVALEGLGFGALRKGGAEG